MFGIHSNLPFDKGVVVRNCKTCLISLLHIQMTQTGNRYCNTYTHTCMHAWTHTHIHLDGMEKGFTDPLLFSLFFPLQWMDETGGFAIGHWLPGDWIRPLGQSPFAYRWVGHSCGEANKLISQPFSPFPNVVLGQLVVYSSYNAVTLKAHFHLLSVSHTHAHTHKITTTLINTNCVSSTSFSLATDVVCSSTSLSVML